MFEATDTYENMERVFSDFAPQLSKLLQQKEIKINGEMLPLRVFYFGDTEFLCKNFGHMGSSSSYPCLWCHVSLRKLRHPESKPHCPMKIGPGNKWVRDENWPENRTYVSYHQDIANLTAEMEDDNSNRISGQDFHSMSKTPILPLPHDLNQIVPPALHILLGLVVRYFKLLEEECRRLDQGDLEERNAELHNIWQRESEITKAAELEFEEAKDALEEGNDILKTLQRAANGRDTQGLTTDACCMPLCRLHVYSPNEVNVNDVQWIRCIECGEGQTKGWYHSYCVGLSKEATASKENDNFTCPVCKGEVTAPEDVIDLQKERVAAHKALVVEKQSDHASKKRALDATYQEVLKSRGSLEKALNEKLENDLKVKRQAYHSQCFVGNHCKIILNKIDILLAVLPDGNFKNDMAGLFRRLRSIFALFKAEFLSDSEVHALCVRCWELGTWFPKKFPKETISPKMHMLICHIPEFVQKWRTVGLLSEHGLESIHKDINSIERIYCTVRESKERMRLVVGNHQQRSSTNTESIQVSAKNKKTCYLKDKTGCKGRYKQCALEKTKRVCKSCGHEISLSP